LIALPFESTSSGNPAVNRMRPTRVVGPSNVSRERRAGGLISVCMIEPLESGKVFFIDCDALDKKSWYLKMFTESQLEARCNRNCNKSSVNRDAQI